MRYRCLFILSVLTLLLIQPLPSRAGERRLVVEAPVGTLIQLDGVFISEIPAAGKITVTLPEKGPRILAMKLDRRIMRTEIAVMPGETLTITADIQKGSLIRHSEPTTVKTVTRLKNEPRSSAEAAPLLKALATQDPAPREMDAQPVVPEPPVVRNGKTIPRFSRRSGVALAAIPPAADRMEAPPEAPPSEAADTRPAAPATASAPAPAPRSSGSETWQDRARNLTRKLGTVSRSVLQQARSSWERLKPAQAVSSLQRTGKRVMNRSRRVLSQGKRMLHKGKQVLLRAGSSLRRLVGLEKEAAPTVPLEERVDAIQVSGEFHRAVVPVDENLSAREKAEQYAENGNFAQAVHWFGVARQEEPDNPWLAYHQAVHLGNSGNPAEGLELAVTTLPQAGASLQPHLRKGIAVLHYQRGQKRMEQGDLSGAILDVQTAERMLPGIDGEDHLQEKIQARLTQQANR